MKLKFSNEITETIFTNLARAGIDNRVSGIPNPDLYSLRCRGFIQGHGRGNLRFTARGRRMADLCIKILADTTESSFFYSDP